MKPVIKSMQEWLKTCPLVASAQDEGVAFRVSWLSPDVDEYSIEDVPTQPILATRLNGTIRQKVFALSSREEYNSDVEHQAERSGFWDDLTAWVEAQSRTKNLPALGDGRIPIGVAVTTTGYIITAEDGRCRAQIQLQIVYFQPKGVATT